MHGMLPMLEYISNWKPALYFPNHCKVCRMEVETVEHLWKCTEEETTKERERHWWKALRASDRTVIEH